MLGTCRDGCTLFVISSSFMSVVCINMGVGFFVGLYVLKLMCEQNDFFFVLVRHIGHMPCKFRVFPHKKMFNPDGKLPRS